MELVHSGPTQEIPSGQDKPMLLTWLANQNAGFPSSYPLADSAA